MQLKETQRETELCGIVEARGRRRHTSRPDSDDQFELNGSREAVVGELRGAVADRRARAARPTSYTRRSPLARRELDVAVVLTLRPARAIIAKSGVWRGEDSTCSLD